MEKYQKLNYRTMGYDYEILIGFTIDNPRTYFNWWAAGRSKEEIIKLWDCFVHELSEFTDYLITKI